MSTHVPGFQSFLGFLHHFILAKLATSSEKVNSYPKSKIPEVCTKPCARKHLQDIGFQ